jgi:hypothetical protein
MDNQYPKICEKGKFKVAKFPNRTTKLIHQMWDEMVIVIIIKKDNKMVTTFEATQIDVKGSLVDRAFEKQKKEATIKEKREKMIDNFIMKKYPKGFDKIECEHVDESIKSEFSNCFPLKNKLVERVKVLVDRFLLHLGRIVYHPLNNKHKNEIKHRILMFHYICPNFVIHADLKNPTKILEMCPRNWPTISNSMFFIVGGQHTIQVVNLISIL